MTTSLDLVSIDSKAVVHLVEKYLKLRQGFIDWLKNAIIEDEGPMFWLTNELPYVASEDSICIPHFAHGVHKISFRDGPRVGYLAHYWSLRLELVMGLIDLCKITPSDLAPGLDISSCSLEANSLAEMLAETIPYISSCLEGRISMHGPLEILDRYNNRRHWIDS